MSDGVGREVRWSYWAIAVVALVFNLMGCANFLSQMNADMIASMPGEIRAIVEARPAWAIGAFAIAVFGGAAGAILLLLRKSAAYYLFIASAIGAIAAQIPLVGMAGLSTEILLGGLSQVIAGAFLAGYAKRAEQKGEVS